MTLEMTSPGDFSLLSISGPDARRFLQGQLSCNMDDLTGRHSLPGAYCNLKGRVIADFMTTGSGESLLLRCAPGMAALMKERLEKYAVFFKVTMDDVSADWQRTGLIGEAATGQLAAATGITPPQLPWETVRPEGMIIVRLPGRQPRLEWLAQKNVTLPAHRLAGSEQDWQLEDIRAGIMHVDAGHSERFTPQVLNYDLDGTINFRKGCYTGQEIVARMHYRGKVDRRLYHLMTDRPIGTGRLSDWKVAGHDKALTAKGEVLLQQPTASGAEMLVILPRKLAEQTACMLYLSAPDAADHIAVTNIRGFE